MDSPISPVPTALPSSLEAWDARFVARWLESVGLGQHVRTFVEHGVTGSVLPLVDDQALADMGVRSVGQRIALSNALYSLKKQHGIPIRANQDYVPASVGVTDASPPGHEPDDSRIAALELHVASLSAAVKTLQRAVTPNTPSVPLVAPCSTCGRYACTCPSTTPLSAPAGATLHSQAGQPVPRRRKPPTSPHRSASPTSPASPPHSASSAPPAPLRLPLSAPGSALPQGGMTTGEASSPTLRIGSISNVNTSVFPPDGVKDGKGKDESHSLAAGPASNVHAAENPSTVTFANDTAVTNAKNDPVAGTVDSAGASTGPSARGSAYKSFRVTMEDPTDKVLPAALKKYKIVDDWKQYVLFICYNSVAGAGGPGDQERCMSLDERPLLLFQKLRDQQQNPVFMLRHIRDVKSPEAIARDKAIAAKAAKYQANELRKRTANDVGSTGTDRNSTAVDSTASFLTTTDDVPAPAIHSRVTERREWHIASRSGLDPPIGTNDSNLRTWAGPNISPERASATRLTGPGATLPPLPSPTYAVAIYPYTKERADELDVTVGDSYIVMSKAKGWWIVQGDPLADGTGAYDYDPSAGPIPSLPGPTEAGKDLPLVRVTGWVPAGCLLEMSRPLLNPGASLKDLKHVVSLPIAPSLILSTSTPGTLLMTYDAQAFASIAGTPSSGASTSSTGPCYDEADSWLLPKETHLRVFKRYNHWSYCVQESGNHARGWVPSWFIGKGSSKSRSSRANAPQGTTAVGHTHTPSTPVMTAPSATVGTTGGPES